jgi:hypothetical protein
LLNPGQTYEEMIIQVEDALNQEWQILLYFAPGATGIGDATSVSVQYMEAFNGGYSQGLTKFLQSRLHMLCSRAGGTRTGFPLARARWHWLPGGSPQDLQNPPMNSRQ